ncbi:FxsB family cyclophane-forming radical SAM/SPASM peptide maturase [Phytohabitans houttuyneae]|uniref:Radical SAM protein n=1 Tax=Phytohabitans houttuyneae TaxID=1076126 RepID=A0A6V8JY08_9ACTN|nr:FxsB family cyclophane-forming radical SAM/SPASM peptide maturase [Phytohabitans houttuyneae]GFJ77633.1 radical SAM protein [Phytohabitans houttuyneae]
MSAAVRQVILKIHSRCNLACDYCYVYESADQSWRGRPRTMTRATIDLVAARIAEHARTHRPPRLTVTLHGGEPILAGADLIEHAVATIRRAVPFETWVEFTIQTNGLLLTDYLLELLESLGVRVGISLDGDREANDRHRMFRHGGGSYSRVREALELLRQERFRHIYGGILCTVDTANDPLAVYRHLLSFAPPRIDFLLPHGNWTTPPPRREPGGSGTPYADWLIPVFDEWYAGEGSSDVRLFSSIIALLVGGTSATEAVGLRRSPLLVIETDGSVEQADSLKTTAAGMAATGCDVATHSFDEALAHPGITAQYRGLAGLAAPCQSCEIVSVCGGGLYAHRYSAGNGFDNPTVYCPDQLRLIQHIRRRVATDLDAVAATAAARGLASQA